MTQDETLTRSFPSHCLCYEDKHCKHLKTAFCYSALCLSLVPSLSRIVLITMICNHDISTIFLTWIFVEIKDIVYSMSCKLSKLYIGLRKDHFYCSPSVERMPNYFEIWPYPPSTKVNKWRYTCNLPLSETLSLFPQKLPSENTLQGFRISRQTFGKLVRGLDSKGK